MCSNSDRVQVHPDDVDDVSAGISGTNVDVVHDNACGIDVGDNGNVVSHSRFNSKQGAFTSLLKAYELLHEIETGMLAINIMFDNIKSVLQDIHNQMLSQHHFEILRDEPLMFDGVVERIKECHTQLSKHLDVLKEQVLIGFCFINNARHLVYSV